MTASSDNNLGKPQRFALRARAALYILGLLGSGFLLTMSWEAPSLWALLIGGALLFLLSYGLLAHRCNQRFREINQAHNAPFAAPQLIPLMSGFMLTVPPLCWVLVLNASPWYEMPQLLHIGLICGNYMTAGLALLLLLNKWLHYKTNDAKSLSAPLLNALFLASLLATAGFYGLLRFNQHQTRQAEQALNSRANLLLDLMENSVRVHLHNNRYMPDRLHEAYDALSNIDQVEGARLFTQQGQVIIEAWPVDKESPFNEALYSRDDVLLRTRNAHLDRAGHPLGMGARGGRGMRGGPGSGGGAGTGQGPQAWLPFPSGPHQLLIVLDKSSMLEAMSDIHRNTLFGLAALSLIALITVGLGWSRYRRLGLESSLVVAREQAAHLERLAQMGAGLAHETKNPLGIVRGLAQSITDSESQNETVRRYAQDIVDESDRIVGQINRFLKLARPEAPRMETIALEGFLVKLQQLIQQESAERQIALHVETIVPQIKADPEQLRQALLNLLLNAFAACEAGDAVTVRCETVPDDLSKAVLHVSDTGCGIAPEDLDKVRQPYFTKFPGGVGLGLALVEEIARNHGWRVTIRSELGQGTLVSIHGIKTVR